MDLQTSMTPRPNFTNEQKLTRWLLWAWVMVALAGYMFQFVPIIGSVLTVLGLR